MRLSFINPLPKCDDLILITYDNMVIGSVELDDNIIQNIIKNIDINPAYFNDIKNYFLKALLFELGINKVEVFVKKCYRQFYEDLGFIFKKCSVLDDDMVVLGV